jgi:hypothetical protein
MISVITWLWGDGGYHAEHVRRLQAAVRLHLGLSHEFICVTDQTIPGVHTLRPPVHPMKHRGCLARLEMLSAGNALTNQLRPWIWHLDLDSVICGNLDPLFTGLSGSKYRAGIYAAKSVGRHGVAYNPSCFLFQKGAFDDVYLRWRAEGAGLCYEARRSGWVGSDQAILGYLIRDRCKPWGTQDGIFSFRDDYAVHQEYRPTTAKIVSFYDRWPELLYNRVPGWIAELWPGKINRPCKPFQGPWIYDAPLNAGRKLRNKHLPDARMFTSWADVPRGAEVWLPREHFRKLIPEDYIFRYFDEAGEL